MWSNGCNENAYICSVEANDTSGFIDDRGDCAASVLKEGANTLVRRIRLGTRWYVAKSCGHGIDAALGKELLRKEFELLSRLSHRNIVRAHSFEELPGYGPSLILDWIDGVPIDQYLKSEEVSRADRRRLSEQLVDAVGYIHDRNMTHRDIKPSNLLVDPRGNLTVIDFGLADDPASCLFKRVTGTEGYTAPELADADAAIDWRRADVYALGLMLREIDGGYLYRRVARRCMNVNPAGRPATGGDVRNLYSAMKKRLKAAVIVLLIAIAAVPAVLFIPDRPADDGNHFTPYNNSVTADSVAVITAPEPETAPEIKPEKRKTDSHDKRPTEAAPDVNFAILRALDIRDSLRYEARQSGRGDYDRAALDRQTDRLLTLGRKAGWSDAEYDFARMALKSDEFYDGKSPEFYHGQTHLAGDTLSIDTP